MGKGRRVVGPSPGVGVTVEMLRGWVAGMGVGVSGARREVEV